ncbi:MAG: hypothetical protein NVSMB25_00800 [Thermoleophilaceae bacterium]
MSEITVAVATQGPPSLLQACLDGLRRGRVEAPVLVVLSAVPARERGALACAVGSLARGLVLDEFRPGASRARNRALAECPEDGIVAFLDDDSLVCPNWFESLRAAWAEAGPQVGCIGGPIDVDLVGASPTWVSPTLLSAYSRLDFGQVALNLDTEVRALAGPNMSFRVGALRAIGGFDPAYGHSGRRMWFGEEHEAQCALARLGYTVRYDPRPRVLHTVAAETVTARALLRRRLVYGATLGERGLRSRGLAARASTLAAAGTVVAAARLDRRLAMLRAFRTAENAGVLLAPLLRP